MIKRFFRLRNWNIISKMVGINVIILVVGSLSITQYIIPLYEQSLRDAHKNHVATLVEMATSVLEGYQSRVVRKELTLQEAQASAIAALKVMASRNDYLWVHNLDLVMIAHPYAPSLERKQLAQITDPSGRYIFLEMKRIISEQGSGFIEYLWPKPAYAEPVPKVSCIKLFAPWGWVVGSGVYYDDVSTETASLRSRVIATASFVFVAIILFSFYAARKINMPLKQALQITNEIAHTGTVDIQQLETSDEPRRLLHAIEMMVTELKESKDQAERANSAKGDFLARMSHEIRTPINAVVGLSELALDSAVSDEQREYLEGIRFSAEHLTGLINSILDHSKIESGRLELEQIAFSVRDTFAAAVQPLAFRAHQKGLTLGLTIADNVPARLKGDPVRLSQIVTNLLSNAIKFTESGSVSCAVACLPSASGQVSLQMTIRDSGIGMTDEAMQRIFHPFAQADSSMTRRYGGTGLGLSIVKQLVEMLGGEIAVTSRPGQGSEFRCTTLFGMVDESAGGEEPGVPVRSSRSLSVLVAEDVKVNQVIVTRFLEKLGHRVTVVDNGREAVEAWKADRFDLVLMDVQMPEMDGLAATRAIREQERRNGGRVPVYAMTAHVMPEDVALCLEAGMDDHLAKPIKRSALTEVVEAHAQQA